MGGTHSQLTLFGRLTVPATAWRQRVSVCLLSSDIGNASVLTSELKSMAFCTDIYFYLNIFRHIGIFALTSFDYN